MLVEEWIAIWLWKTWFDLMFDVIVSRSYCNLFYCLHIDLFWNLIIIFHLVSIIEVYIWWCHKNRRLMSRYGWSIIKDASLFRCFFLTDVEDLMRWDHIGCSVRSRSIGEHPIWDGRVGNLGSSWLQGSSLGAGLSMLNFGF